jgi:hypothetical protein
MLLPLPLARHSGEGRNPVTFSCALLVIPAKAGIQFFGNLPGQLNLA